jgi:hypothetical protein
MPEPMDTESAYAAAMAVLTDQLSEIISTLDAQKAWSLGMTVGNMVLAAHATGRREAFAEAQSAILREARRGEHQAPPQVHLTYTGGLRRASKVIEPLLGQAMEAEAEQRSRTSSP